MNFQDACLKLGSYVLGTKFKLLVLPSFFTWPKKLNFPRENIEINDELIFSTNPHTTKRSFPKFVVFLLRSELKNCKLKLLDFVLRKLVVITANFHAYINLKKVGRNRIWCLFLGNRDES